VQDVGSKASEFGHLSGLYSMELIVGDAVLSNSFSWKVADVVLKFSDSVPAPSPAKDQYLYAPKPEIKVCICELLLL
jgi:oligosaccharyltransferase complex subunit delta (ribophorin II)